MSLGDKLQSKNVRIFALALILLFVIVGVIWLYNSGDEAQPHSLTVIPDISNASTIRYKLSDRYSVRGITNEIERALEQYNSTGPNVYKGCNFLNPPPLGKTCHVDLTALSPCTKDNLYSYARATPCIFLKLSIFPEWVPQFYNETELPDSMPADLKQDIQNLVRANKRNAEMVWVSCEGRTPDDNDKVGPLLYLPRRGFPGFFYPCSSTEGCTQPLVAIQFEKPARNVTINVECKIWAKNLNQAINFDMMIE